MISNEKWQIVTKVPDPFASWEKKAEASYKKCDRRANGASQAITGKLLQEMHRSTWVVFLIEAGLPPPCKNAPDNDRCALLNGFIVRKSELRCHICGFLHYDRVRKNGAPL